jgi:hypothetical protein
MCLCIDVVLAMYKPFAPSASRVNTYYLFTTIVTIFSLVFFIYTDVHPFEDYADPALLPSARCIKKPNSDALTAIPQNGILAIFYVVYFFVAVSSTIYALKKLYKSGFN